MSLPNNCPKCGVGGRWRFIVDADRGVGDVEPVEIWQCQKCQELVEVEPVKWYNQDEKFAEIGGQKLKGN